MKTSPTYRLDETLWSFQQRDQEIRILTPRFSDRSADDRLAKKAKESLEANSNAVEFEYRSSLDLLGKWQIVDRTQEMYKKLQEGSIISTASDRKAESSTDSLLADFNPKGIGSLSFIKGDKQSYFQRCTMPVWVGYLLIGDVEKAVESFIALSSGHTGKKQNANGKEENLLRFLAWQEKDPSLNIREIYQAFKKRIGAKELDAFFKNTRCGEEWAKYNKIAQDIHFMGHSLEAALSQGGLYHFGFREGRIPLAGCHFKCYAYYPLGGVTVKENQQFLAFGRQNKELLQKLGQKWELYYQFEYPDFVPPGGEEWLGVAKDNDLDSDWLEVTGILFKTLLIDYQRNMIALQRVIFIDLFFSSIDG